MPSPTAYTLKHIRRGQTLSFHYEAGIHRTDIAAEAEVAAAALQDFAQGTRGFGVSVSSAYTVKHIRKGLVRQVKLG